MRHRRPVLIGTLCAAWLLAAVPAHARETGRADTARAPGPGAAPSGEAGDGSRSFEIPATWGPLKARYRASARGKGRAVLIVGAVGRSLDGMDPLARKLQAAGYSTLSIGNPATILRKDSLGMPIVDKRRLSTGGIPDLVRDAEAGLRFLRDEPTAFAPIVVVGEGLGVPIAAHLAAENEIVAAVAFVTPAKECDPVVTRSVLDAACARKPALLVTGHKDETYRAWFAAQQPGSGTITFVDPLTRPGGAEEEQAAWASYVIPFPEDVLSWLAATAPPDGPHGAVPGTAPGPQPGTLPASPPGSRPGSLPGSLH